MASFREIAIGPPACDGAVLYVEHYLDAKGAPADEAVATHFLGKYLDGEGQVVGKRWGAMPRPVDDASDG